MKVAPPPPADTSGLLERMQNQLTPFERSAHLCRLLRQRHDAMLALRQHMRELRSQLNTLRRDIVLRARRTELFEAEAKNPFAWFR